MHKIPLGKAILRKRRWRFLNLTWDDVVRYFFGGNAFMAVVVLALITIFLFREGFGFARLYRDDLTLYRRAGLEYVDILRGQSDRFTDLARELNRMRLDELKRLLKEGAALAEANAALAGFDQLSTTFSNAGGDLYGLVSDLGDVATETRNNWRNRGNALAEQARLRREGKASEAAAVEVAEVDFAGNIQVLRSTVEQVYPAVTESVVGGISAAFQTQPSVPSETLARRLKKFGVDAQDFAATFPVTRKKLAEWDPAGEVGISRALWGFLTGKQWLTNSSWQDRYGILPLFTGSLLVSLIALTLAIPLGIAGAIYVNQVASPREAGLIKPTIEFIAAFPSVVLGFFGIVVLGSALRELSTWEALSWVPFFPISERLNATTAGVLLGLMAVPTIFSLAEDAINNVPVHFKEASFALGASRLQTLVRVILPASLSGIIAAILLGFGRVIGETMVVLLCAGNRIQIPDFTRGPGVMVEPVHTMTGIIAQEMGEVDYGGIHYRALFMVAIFLFLLALFINFLAQKIVTRYRISIG